MSKIDDEIVTVGKSFPKIAKVSALEGFFVRVTWKNGRPSTVDLSPTILSLKAYAPLRTDRKLFESVHVVNASVIAWGDDDAIDMHVSEVERLAGDVMTPADFKAFLEAMDLTWDAAAAALGISRRMVGYYTSSSDVPRYIALACAHLKHRRQENDYLERELYRIVSEEELTSTFRPSAAKEKPIKPPRKRA